MSCCRTVIVTKYTLDTQEFTEITRSTKTIIHSVVAGTEAGIGQKKTVTPFQRGLSRNYKHGSSSAFTIYTYTFVNSLAIVTFNLRLLLFQAGIFSYSDKAVKQIRQQYMNLFLTGSRCFLFRVKCEGSQTHFQMLTDTNALHSPSSWSL